MGTNAARLKVEHISKTFPGTRALTDATLEIMPGEVHALVGENGAGKSTLMNIVGGCLAKDEGVGKIFIDGKEVNFTNPTEAIQAGIGFVHQELNVFQHLSVAFNIFVDRMPMTRLHRIDRKKLNAEAKKLMDTFQLDISPNTQAGKLSIGNQQMVEIMRAVSLNAKIIIFDEPTSSLSEKEVEQLFAIIQKLKANGVSIVYISHKMGEIFQICDKVSVLRDGCMVASFNVKETTSQELVNNMVGREIDSYYVSKSSGIGEELLRVTDLRRTETDEPINFVLKKNEILGFYGLVGAGRSELLRAVCGIDRKYCGHVFLEGKEIKIKTYHDALKCGITYLTENRKETGIFPSLSVAKNIYVSDMCRKKGMLLNNAQENSNAMAAAVSNNIKTSNVREKIVNLSGGNQQKVILARCLNVKPRIIILDEPTRGIDVNAKAEIHKRVRALAESGMGVIVISSEMPEIMGLSDEIVVMHDGKITGLVKEENMNEKNIIQYATEVYD